MNINVKCNDAYILVKGTIAVAARGTDAAVRQADERNIGVIFKNCTPYISWQLNNIQQIMQKIWALLCQIIII